MDLNEFIVRQEKLVRALYKLDILALEEILLDGADLFTRSDIINNCRSCLNIIVESLSKEGFKELCKVFIPYLIQNYSIIYVPFMNEMLRFCSQLTTKDNIDEIIWSNLEYFLLLFMKTK